MPATKPYTTKLQALHEQREELLAECQTILDAADEAKRSLSEDERKTYTEKLSASKELLDQIRTREALLAEQGIELSNRRAERETVGDDGGWSIPVRELRNRQLSILGPEAEKNAYLSGRFVAATIFGHEDSRLWCKEHGIDMLAAREGYGEKGGHLVPTQFEQNIIDLRERYGVFRREVRFRPMASDSMVIPRRKSGLTAYFVGEGVAPTASDLLWNRVELVAKKMAALWVGSSEIAEDSYVDMGATVADEMAYCFATKEDDCGFNGDGTSTYGRMTGVAVRINDGNHAASIHTAASGNTGFETLDIEDFLGCVGKLPEYAEGMAKWYISKAGFAASMQRLMYAGGGNTYLDYQGKRVLAFLGYPVVITQKLNATLGADASKIKVLFGDLNLATTAGERRGLTIAQSTEYGFATDELAIKGTQRWCMNAHDLGDGSSAGPLVALKTPAS